MKFQYITLIIIQFLNIQLTSASFLPENIEIAPEQLDWSKSFSPINTYEVYINEIKSVFSPIFSNEGGKLDIQIKNGSKTVNAFARRTGLDNENWEIVIHEGLLRHKKLSPEVLTVILCHEIGHHLGGRPTKGSKNWVSVEGQADYYGVHYCLKTLRNSSKLSFNLNTKIPSKIKLACESQFNTQEEINFCYQSIAFSEATANFLSVMGQTRRGRRGANPKLDKRDKNIVTSTTTQHPNRQCRLDTMIEASLCNNQLIEKNCQDTATYYEGARPRCWFFPEI